MKRRAASRRTFGKPLECVLFGWAALLAVAAAPSVRADAVAYLAGAGFVSGTVLECTGGAHLTVGALA